ncbi:MAG: transketolase family protein [Planctomycetota bacterium]|nr:transketolase family protein [Planctomycetota bacterium]MDI6787083.1 transketolase family protein [Planctomycetota bacterium]
MPELKCTRESCGKALVELGKRNHNVVVLSADLAGSTKADEFAKTFPGRFFNMGVAEANMINTAAGLAVSGKIPFATTFAIFASGRAWEQVRNTVAYSGLNVKTIATHGGISVGPDGASHQGIEDIALMRLIPGMTVLVPADAVQTPKAIFASAEYYGPVYIRLARLKIPVVTKDTDSFIIGKSQVLKEGTDVTIIACGTMVAAALSAAEVLLKDNINATVINAYSIKPLDTETIIFWARKTGVVVTAEEHLLAGGLGSAVAETLSPHRIPIEMVAIKDRFGQSGEPDELLKEYHLTDYDIVEAARRVRVRAS